MPYRLEQLEHPALVSSLNANPIVCNGDAQLVIAEKLDKESDLSFASCKLKGIAI